MLRLGSPPLQAREMDLNDIFLSRLRLLIIMSRAFLDDLPLGDYRRQAMLENARHIETESIELGRFVSGGSYQHTSDEATDFDHVFYQRVKLLAVMVKAIAKGFPMGDHRKAAMRENVEIISQTPTFNSQMDMAFLKVA